MEDQEANLDDNEDEDKTNEKKRRIVEQYRTYLKRSRKQRKILQRSNNIEAELTSKLQGRSASDMPQVFYTSASEYMDRICKAKLGFAHQPALTPEMTGIPALRKFLFSLSSQQNLRDYEKHIGTVIPAFIEKVKRTVTENDRDGGFRTIADELDAHRKGFMKRLLSQAKSAFQDSSTISMAKLSTDIPSFKEQPKEKMTADWFTLRAAAFTRIMRCRGVVPKGASKAKGLEQGCHWNQEIAEIPAPRFNK